MRGTRFTIHSLPHIVFVVIDNHTIMNEETKEIIKQLNSVKNLLYKTKILPNFKDYYDETSTIKN
jgi:hypothetical protein